jgi:hypothetical protein
MLRADDVRRIVSSDPSERHARAGFLPPAAYRFVGAGLAVVVYVFMRATTGFGLFWLLTPFEVAAIALVGYGALTIARSDRRARVEPHRPECC